MNVNGEKWFRRLWWANGGLLLVFLAYAVFVVIRDRIWPRWNSREAPVEVPSQATISDSTSPRAVRFGTPASITGTTTRMLMVRYGENELSDQYLSYEASGWDGVAVRQPVVNIVFLPRDGEPRLLLDRPANIREVSYPRSEDDTLQTWIAYDLVLDDTNDDRKLDENDVGRLYVSDLEGRNLRPLLEPGFTVLWHGLYKVSGQMLIFALAPVPEGTRVSEAERPQRVFRYEVASGVLSVEAAVNALVDSAARLLAR